MIDCSRLLAAKDRLDAIDVVQAPITDDLGEELPFLDQSILSADGQAVERLGRLWPNPVLLAPRLARQLLEVKRTFISAPVLAKAVDSLARPSDDAR